MDPSLSLVRLLDPEITANPYPFYRTLRENAPVLWDPFLHTWAVTSYAEAVTVLHRFSGERTLTEEQLDAMGLGALNPIFEVMRRQMLFRDAPAHTRLRSLCANAFTPSRVAKLRKHIEEIVNGLIDRFIEQGSADIVADFAAPMPGIVTAGMLGVPIEHHDDLKRWSIDFAEIFGNFQHNPDRISRVLESVEEMTSYFRAAVRQQYTQPTEGLVNALVMAEVDGSRLTEDEMIANTILTMIGGQETTTNLIASGLVTLLKHPEQMRMVREDPALIPAAIEELLRFESPSQHTARVAREDLELGGEKIKQGQSVIAVIAAANRDPERFSDPDTLDLTRKDNRHLAFGWGAHYCFGAPLARMEGQIAFATLLERLQGVELASDEVTWRENLGLRGLTKLPVCFEPGVRSASAARYEFINA